MKQAHPPVIETPWGTTSEPARLQAAINMLASPEIRRRVEQHLVREFGSEERGLREARRRYPEAYVNV